ncbi:ATP-dependent zinc metalloprotease FTSH 5, mitochondrial [Hordeum vulgare]|nr:ATP-dependent zinc metalloprotease FTSH 5, mitochondrial [Hordeum vulgare]
MPARGSRAIRLPQQEMEALSDDSGWSSSDDLDIEDLLQDYDVEMMGLLLDVQEIEDCAKLMDQRRGSKMGRVTIYRNRGLGHEHLMQDYFTEVPTYPPRLFRRSVNEAEL